MAGDVDARLLGRLADWLDLPTEAVRSLPPGVIEAMRTRMEAEIAFELQDELVGHLVGALGRSVDAARTDELTGLLNRRGLAEHLLELGRRWTLAVMMADVDGFKLINDRFGHAVGDAALRQVGARLRSAVRQRDLVARWGGDEFLVVCPDIAVDAVAPVAEKLLGAACNQPVVVEGVTVPVGLSIGWAIAEDGRAAEHLVEMADEAMYRAKAAGGRRVAGGNQG
jgi:diguanylate cyclase (GGDEF)-like protein